MSGAQTFSAVTTSNLSAANIKSGVTVKVGDSGDSGRITNISGTFTSTVSQGQTKATAAKILSGYSAYIDGSEIKGSISSKSAATYNVSSSDQTISSGQYLSGAQTIRGVTTNNLSDGSKILSGTTIKVGDSANAGRIVSIAGTHVCPTYYATGSWSGARFNLSTTTTSSSALDYYDADVTISQIGSAWYEYLRVWNKGASDYTTISSTQKQIQLVDNGNNAVKLQLSNGTSWFDKLSYTHNKFPNSIVCTNAHDYASNDYYADISYGGSVVERTIAAKNASGTNLKTAALKFVESTYTNSSGTTNQRCVNISFADKRIGRIDIQNVYDSAYPTAIECTNAHDYASNDNYADINYGGTAVNRTIAAKNSAGSVLKSVNFAFMRTTYTNSSGLSNQRCVNMSLGGVRIGRIDIQDVYIAGWDAVSHAFVMMGNNDSSGKATFYSTSYTIPAGTTIDVWPAFRKFSATSGSTTPGDYVNGSRYRFTASSGTKYTLYKGYNTDDTVYYGKLYKSDGTALTGESYYWYGCKTNFGTTASVNVYTH